MDEAHRVLGRDYSSFAAYLPHIVVALVIAVAGGLLAALAGRLVRMFVSRLGLDDLGHRNGLTEDLASVGIRARPSMLIARLMFFILSIAVLDQAVDALGFVPLSSDLHDFLSFMPHVVLAAFVVLLGVIVGDTVSRGASGAMSRAGVLYHGAARSILRSAIIAAAVLIALQQLTVDSDFFLYLLLVVVGTAGLAFAIAAGWGARTLAENLIASRYVERELSIGAFVRCGDVAGRVEEFGATSVILRADDGRRLTVPNAMFSSAVVETLPDGDHV